MILFLLIHTGFFHPHVQPLPPDDFSIASSSHKNLTPVDHITVDNSMVISLPVDSTLNAPPPQ